MTDIVERLRAMHDRLNLNVMAGGFKTLVDRGADCEAAMKECWQAADEIERLRAAIEFAHSEGFEWPADPLPGGFA